MADSAVAITAGSGTNIDTRTESTNSNHRQVVVIGDPSSNAGVAAVVDASEAPLATDPALVVVIRPDTVNSNGQATMANSSPVVIASDQSALLAKGDIAHDAADSGGGGPVKIGGQARTTLPTAVADADRTNFIGDKFGRTVTTIAPRELSTNQQASATDTTETTFGTAGGSGVYLDLVSLIITNTSATGTVVSIRDASGGTVRFTVYAPANQTVGFTLPGGVTWKQTTANNAWTFQSGTSVTTLYVAGVWLQNK